MLEIFTMMTQQLGKAFEPQTFENQVYENWEKQGCFESKDVNAPGQKPFCIVIPPPNVTGVLHMGHALTCTIQDILIRWRRMSGDNTLWLPGTDHAGIATQTQVEKQIAKEGKNAKGHPLTRHDLGRARFLERTWKWKDDHHAGITGQLRRMGSSLDWKRERFTMDEGLSHAVREVFVRLYEEKLIYRGDRIINWCPRCQTALSDLEVIPTDRKGALYHLVYPVVDAKGVELTRLTIATTRPETLLGDTAVAVHPEDERYQKFIGMNAKLPLTGRLIPIIGDAYVDREFGTGALKVTPAHDFNDNELGKRHNLPLIEVMGKDGRMTEAAGAPYTGLKFKEAREKVIEDLKAQGTLVKVEDHAHKVGLCQRCENVAEPLISKQWFVKIEPLARPAIEAVETGKIEFTPKSWEKTYFEWMRNIRDWCISRQLWWGHQIPAWYCAKCEGVTVSRTDPSQCSSCGADSSQLTRDEDVLDTWFSSALWPFSTLGWPENTAALKTFYPTAILETGFDIIFFWVARMIMMGMHFMGDVPFKKVYLHAMVRDEKGEKMSKSKGNVIDPLELIDKHGADPLRFTLAAMAGQGRDIKLSVDRVEGYRAFCNKLWNAVKFFHLQLEPTAGAALSPPSGGALAWCKSHREELLPSNRWILSLTQDLIAQVEQGFASFQLDEAARALYEFTWREYCDWFIELSKLPLRDEKCRAQTVYTLHASLELLLKTMHPLTPFVTEELWQSLPWKTCDDASKPQVLMLQKYPRRDESLVDREAVSTVQALKAIIEPLRNFRGENNISPKVQFPLEVIAKNAMAETFVKTHQSQILALARVEKITLSLSQATGANQDPDISVIPITEPSLGLALELRIRLEGLVDRGEEIKRLAKEIAKVRDDLGHVQGKLGKESFMAKAPPALVEKTRAEEKQHLARLSELEATLQRLESRSKA